MSKINIAIDGPSAAGKSTVAKLLASRLGYVHLDTGAMYRSCAYKAKLSGISIEDEAAVCSMLDHTKIVLTPNGEVLLDGKDVSKEIRADEISSMASKVSALCDVRKNLVMRQQEMAKEKGFIMDGRDIGTVVLKDAEVKVYLTASAHARALRRLKQNRDENISDLDLETIEKEIEERDYRDMHREFSPLCVAEDAIVIDSSDMTRDEVLEEIMNLVDACVKEESR